MKIKKKNELLSSVYGRIEGLTLAIPLNITDFPYRAYFTELVEVFFEKEIILFYPKAETDKQAEYYSKVLNSLPKSKLLFVETGEKQLSPWTRDAFLGLSAAENETVLLNTYAQPQNRNLAAELAKVKKHIQIQRVNLNLTGGNILKADDYALFGNRKENNDPVLLKTYLGDIDYIPIVSDYKITGSWARGKTTSDGFLNYYSALDRHQAIFHIDLFITLAGSENGT